MTNSNFVFDELLRLNLRTDRHEIFIPTASASLLTKFQSSSNCNNEKAENSLGGKILVFAFEKRLYLQNDREREGVELRGSNFYTR